MVVPSALAHEPGCVTLQAFPVPAGDRPHDVAPAADGVRVWYTGQGSGHLGLLEPLTGDVERISLGEGSSPHGVIVGPDGAAWVTDGGRDEIQRINPDSHEIARFPTGVARGNLNTAAIDGDGNVWFTGQSGIVGRLDPENGEMTTAEAPRGPGPYGICTAPDGEIWFVSLAGSYLGRLSVRNGEIRVSELEPPTEGAGLRRVWSDSAGRLWVAEWTAGKVGCYDPASKEWREWRLPGERPQAYAVFVDDRDIVWLTDFGSNALVRFDPVSETFDAYPLPHLGANVRQLLGRPGEVWGAESGTDHLVVARTICSGP
ncbi:MAG: lyase [Thermomicrobiales bacterium]|nr:lyase [Thermomicrobiales bacterium]